MNKNCGIYLLNLGLPKKIFSTSGNKKEEKSIVIEKAAFFL